MRCDSYLHLVRTLVDFQLMPALELVHEFARDHICRLYALHAHLLAATAVAAAITAAAGAMHPPSPPAGSCGPSPRAWIARRIPRGRRLGSQSVASCRTACITAGHAYSITAADLNCKCAAASGCTTFTSSPTGWSISAAPHPMQVASGQGNTDCPGATNWYGSRGERARPCNNLRGTRSSSTTIRTASAHIRGPSGSGNTLYATPESPPPTPPPLPPPARAIFLLCTISIPSSAGEYCDVGSAGLMLRCQLRDGQQQPTERKHPSAERRVCVPRVLLRLLLLWLWQHLHGHPMQQRPCLWDEETSVRPVYELGEASTMSCCRRKARRVRVNE